MNFLDPMMSKVREARIRYLDAEFQILREGEYVLCAVTGERIRLDELRYWSVERQVAYRSAEVAFGEFLRGFRSAR